MAETMSVVSAVALGKSRRGGSWGRRGDRRAGVVTGPELTNTSVGLDVGSHLRGRHQAEVALVRQPARENPVTSRRQLLRAGENVGDTGTTQGPRAGRFIIRADGEDAIEILLRERGFDVGEDISFDERLAGGLNIKGMTAVVGPVIVVSVPVAALSKLGGATRCMMDVVAGKGDLLVLAQAEAVQYSTLEGKFFAWEGTYRVQ